MAQEYYLGKRKPSEEHKVLRRVLLIAGAVALLTTLILLVYNNRYHARMTETLSSFKTKMEDSDFPGALEMYREIHEQVMSQPSGEETRERLILQEMEQIVKEKTDVLTSKMRSDRYVPDATEKSFLEQMSEVTGAVISTWLVDLSHEFLFMRIERPTLQFVIDQLSDCTNIASACASLQKSMDSIERASGQVQIAEKLMSEDIYIDAIVAYQTLFDEFVSEDEFVSAFCRDRIQQVKEEMYEPMLQEARDLMVDFKFYSAEGILSQMIQFFPGDQVIQQMLLESTANTALVQTYYGDVEVLSVRPLLADTNLAFSAGLYQYTEDGYLSTTEFSRILEALHEDNYILIDVRIMADLSNPAELRKEELRLPEGKKPLVIIVENLNYSPRSSGLGFCRRLVLNEQNQVCGEYITAAGETIVDRMAESIGILDAFVEKHPDFSYDGAKGIISLSGFEVVMGYVTHEDQIDDYNEMAEKASALQVMPDRSELEASAKTVSEIIHILKETGWVIASSSYGYRNMDYLDMEEIQEDTQKWLDQIGPLTGAVEVLVYPNGSYINGSDPRCVYLKDLGFRIFFGISSSPYFVYGDNYLYLDRVVLNGLNLRTVNHSRLFTASEIYDQDRRKPFSG